MAEKRLKQEMNKAMSMLRNSPVPQVYESAKITYDMGAIKGIWSSAIRHKPFFRLEKDDMRVEMPPHTLLANTDRPVKIENGTEEEALKLCAEVIAYASPGCLQTTEIQRQKINAALARLSR